MMKLVWAELEKQEDFAMPSEWEARARETAAQDTDVVDQAATINALLVEVDMLRQALVNLSYKERGQCWCGRSGKGATSPFSKHTDVCLATRAVLDAASS